MEGLQSTISFLETKIESASAESKPQYQTALSRAQSKLLELIEAVDTSPNTKDASSSSQTYKRNSQIKSIESALSDTSFKGLDINETTRFVERLEKIYIITVTGKDPTLEADFLDLVKLRLSDPVFKNLHASQVDVSTFIKLKNWLKTTYGGNFNAFQILQRAWDIEFKPEEKFSVYAQKVSEEMRTGAAAIQKQLSAVKGTAETSTADIEFTLEFVAGLLVSNNLRSYCWPLYKDMVNDMDKMLTSAEVANKAEYYRERLGGDFLGKSTEAYWANPSQQPGTLKKVEYGTGAKPKSKPKKTGNASYNPGQKYPNRNCRYCNESVSGSFLDHKCSNRNGNSAMHANSSTQPANQYGPTSNTSIYAPTTPFH